MDIKAARLTDPALEKQLQQDGLVVLKEWLSQDEIAAIRQMYENAHPLKDPTRTNMWNSLYDIEPHAALLASQQILAILKPRLNELFSAYNAPVAVMIG